MSKLHVTLIAVLLIALASLTVLAVGKYEHSVKGLSVAQAVAEKDSATGKLTVEQGINRQLQANNASETTQVNTLTSQKSALCAELVKYKLTNPVCQ